MNKANTGFTVLNGNCSELPNKTVLVLGLPRGGTSMAAGIVAKLGVFMGSKEKLEPFYENVELERCLKQKDKIEAKKFISAYDETYPVWGLKIMPGGWRFWLAGKLFREPVYVLVLRDILAIAKRRAVSLDKSILREMFAANLYYLALMLFLYFCRRPVILLSYEKALLYPEAMVDGIADFLGINDENRRREAMDFVIPSPADYVMQSTTTSQLDAEGRYFGYLDIVEPNRVIGWALAVHSAEPVSVRLTVNGMAKAETAANLIRDDVHKSDPAKQPNCGFIFDLAGIGMLNPGDTVEVQIAEQNIHLINSPYHVH